MTAAVKIHPSLLSCIKFAVRTFGIILAVVLVLGSIVNLLNGRPFMGVLLTLQLAALFIGFGAALGLILYLIFRVCSWSVESTGLSGRSYWGRRTHIGWTDIGKVGHFSVEGIPALVVTSATSKKEIVAYTLGVSLPEVHQQLVRHAGQDHVLTQWFRPTAA